VSETLDYFEQLGTHVDQRWTAVGRLDDLLPDIAADALREIPVPGSLTPESILTLVTSGGHLPRQRSGFDPFGQPPAIMYRGDGLEIQAITWIDGTTSIHQHGFDGAFRVMWGSSLHVPYGFERGETLADGHMIAGSLAMERSEILWTGDVRTIASGFEFIHALFHLERPSVTVVIRNSWSDHPFPQYEYRLPGIGVDSLFADDLLDLRLRGLHSLHRIDGGAARQVALDVVTEQDLWTAFRVCDSWARGFSDMAGLQPLVEELGRRDSTLHDLLEPMYAEELRRARLLARRGMLQESHHRLLLALIVNLPDRSSIHDAVGQAFPGRDPDELILEWVRELASPALRGISGLTLTADELDKFQAPAAGGDGTQLLDAMAGHWKPPSLFEKLFV
jgi:hypothetical protein